MQNKGIVVIISFKNFIIRNFRVFAIMIFSLTIAVYCGQYLSIMFLQQLEQSKLDFEKKGRNIELNLNNVTLSDCTYIINFLRDNDVLSPISQISLIEKRLIEDKLITIIGIDGALPEIMLVEGDISQLTEDKNTIVISNSLIQYDDEYSMINEK